MGHRSSELPDFEAERWSPAERAARIREQVITDLDAEPAWVRAFAARAEQRYLQTFTTD